MNRDLFRSMGEQMGPSEGAKAALREKLSAAPVRRNTPWKKYAALAACAAVIIAAFPVYSAVSGRSGNVRLHSYTLAEDSAPMTQENSAVEDLGGGAPEPAPIPRPATGGGEVSQQDPLSSVDQDEALSLYNGLMEYFHAQYGGESYAPALPDWYGGGYLDNDRPDHIARLTVVLVEDLDTPELRQEIVDALGSEKVDFVPGKYSLSYLRKLQDSFMDYPAIQEVFAVSGVDEMENRVDLVLTEVDDQVLALLSSLDPADDAIYVTVGRRASIDLTVDDVAGSVSHPAAIPDRGPEGAAASKAPQILRPGDDGYVEPFDAPASDPDEEFPLEEVEKLSAQKVAPVDLEEIEKVSAQKVAPVDLEEIEKVSAQKVAPVDLEEVEKVSAQKVAPVDLEEVEKVSAQKVAPAGALEGASPAYDPDEAKFPAVVLEVSGDSVLAECTADDGGLRAGDQVRLSLPGYGLSAGDHIVVVFNGVVLETWPARLGEVYSVAVVQP